MSEFAQQATKQGKPIEVRNMSKKVPSCHCCQCFCLVNDLTVAQVKKILAIESLSINCMPVDPCCEQQPEPAQELSESSAVAGRQKKRQAEAQAAAGPPTCQKHRLQGLRTFPSQALDGSELLQTLCVRRPKLQ